MKKNIILITIILLLFTLIKPVFANTEFIIERYFNSPPLMFKYNNSAVEGVIHKLNFEPPYNLPFINIKISVSDYSKFKTFVIKNQVYKNLMMDLKKEGFSVAPTKLTYSPPKKHVIFMGEFRKENEKFLIFKYYPIIYDETKKRGSWLKSFKLELIFERRILPYGRKGKTSEIPTFLIIGKKSKERDIEFFINYKKEKGFNVVYKPVEEFEGEEISDSIRNYLKENYETMNIKYLLLIGTTEEIPMFVVFPYPNGDGLPVETDFFYGELDSTINFDKDDYPGEPEEDKIDFYSEIGVGRIPEDNLDNIISILNKIIAFESIKVKNKVLLPGAFWNFKEISTFGEMPETDGAYSLKVIFDKTMKNKGFIGTFLSEKEGVKISNVPGDSLTYENFIKYQKEIQPVLILWQGHGVPQATFRKVWKEDKNKDGYFQKEEGEFVKFVDIDSLSEFDPTTPSITFMGACDNMFDVQDSLAHGFLKYYSAGVIASTDTAWYGLGWKDIGDGWLQSIMYKFSENMSNLMDISNALNKAKEYYFENLIFPLQKYERYQNIYVFNILGDPSISLKTHEETLNITSNSVKTNIGKLFEISFTSTKKISSIKGYIEYNPKNMKFFRLEFSGSGSFKEFSPGKILFNIKDLPEKNLFTLLFFAKNKSSSNIKLLNVVIDGNKEMEKVESEEINIEDREYPVWDINLDGIVDGEDLMEFSSHFGSYYPDDNYLDIVDFTMDGIVDGEDLMEFSSHFGENYKGG